MPEFLGGYTPGFRGSARERMGIGYSELVHAVSRRSHHATVCGIQLARYDDRRMCTNPNMETVTCLRCWITPDPFP
jgi:hypothetical protein